MPKVYMTERERKAARVKSYIHRAARVNGITLGSLADELDITRSTLHSKLEKGTLNYYELFVLFRRLKTDEKTILKLMGAWT